MKSPLDRMKKESRKSIASWTYWITLAIIGIIILLELYFRFIIVGVPVSNAPTRSDAKNICCALKAYYSEYGRFPSGDHGAIIRSLRGDNPLKMVFIDLGPKQESAKGEFLDPWGTPYHIDVSESGKPMVYSFGKNRQDEFGKKDSDDVTSWR